MIKYLLVLLTITQVNKCGNQPENTSPPKLKFHFATSQSWSGGAVGSGKGTNYLFYLSPVDSSYSIDSVWVNGYRLHLEKRNDYSSKDTLVLAASAFFPGSRPKAPDDGAEKKGPDESVKPCCPDASVIIRFVFNGNKNFISTSNLKILPKLNYP